MYGHLDLPYISGCSFSNDWKQLRFCIKWINRGYYMAALRNKISFQRLKNNSQESAENN